MYGKKKIIFSFFERKFCYNIFVRHRINQTKNRKYNMKKKIFKLIEMRETMFEECRSCDAHSA